MKEVIIPLGVMLILTAGVTAGFVITSRTHRKAMAEYRDAVRRSTYQQEQVEARIAELTTRVTAVERLLRDVG